jgi:hypothetical protein
MSDNTTAEATPTADTPTAEATPSKGGSDNNYPFRTKKAIKAQILEDDSFCLVCLQTMSNRQARREPDSKGLGWMSSHESRAEALADKARCGDVSPEDVTLARSMVKSYSKQLAAEFRAKDLAADPTLTKVTEAFFRPNGS